jgi:hypothetical protein
VNVPPCGRPLRSGGACIGCTEAGASSRSSAPLANRRPSPRSRFSARCDFHAEALLSSLHASISAFDPNEKVKTARGTQGGDRRSRSQETIEYRVLLRELERRERRGGSAGGRRRRPPTRARLDHGSALRRRRERFARADSRLARRRRRQPCSRCVAGRLERNRRGGRSICAGRIGGRFLSAGLAGRAPWRIARADDATVELELDSPRDRRAGRGSHVGAAARRASSPGSSRRRSTAAIRRTRASCRTAVPTTWRIRPAADLR